MCEHHEQRIVTSTTYLFLGLLLLLRLLQPPNLLVRLPVLLSQLLRIFEACRFAEGEALVKCAKGRDEREANRQPPNCARDAVSPQNFPHAGQEG